MVCFAHHFITSFQYDASITANIERLLLNIQLNNNFLTNLANLITIHTASLLPAFLGTLPEKALFILLLPNSFPIIQNKSSPQGDSVQTSPSL